MNKDRRKSPVFVFDYRSGCSAVASALALGARCRGFDSRHPDHFFALIPRQKNMKPSGSLHAPQVRFMARRAASYGAAVLHKRLTMKHCSAKAPQYEASPFHSAMKHSLRSYDEKIKNESLSVCNTTLSVLYYKQKGTFLWKKLPINLSIFLLPLRLKS